MPEYVNGDRFDSEQNVVYTEISAAQFKKNADFVFISVFKKIHYILLLLCCYCCLQLFVV